MYQQAPVTCYLYFYESGCIVRNTFLEWQESELSNDQVSSELAGEPHQMTCEMHM